jgi:hypothetical protein
MSSSSSSHSVQTQIVLQTKCQLKNKRKRTTTTHLRPYESKRVRGSDFDCKVTTRALQMKSCAQCSIDLKPAIAGRFGGSHNKMASCKYCDSEIAWEEEEDFAGEMHWTPTDPLTGQRHRCKERKSIYVPRPIRCYKCNRAITFDEGRLSKSGKKIPIDPDSRENHRCPGT